MSDNDVLDLAAIDALTQAVNDGLIPKISGVEIVFTGKLSMSRNDMFSLVRAFGGLPMTTITHRTRYLVAANPHGNSTKLQAALRRGVPILTETAFIERLVSGQLVRA